MVDPECGQVGISLAERFIIKAFRTQSNWEKIKEEYSETDRHAMKREFADIWNNTNWCDDDHFNLLSWMISKTPLPDIDRFLSEVCWIFKKASLSELYRAFPQKQHSECLLKCLFFSLLIDSTSSHVWLYSQQQAWTYNEEK